MRTVTPVLDRLLARIVIATSGCWEFQGAKTYGYGVIGLGARTAGTALTHRVLWEAVRGPVPAGLDLDHLCRNRACCNPDHLEPVTRAVNVARGLRAKGYAVGRTHCKNGHEYTPENTFPQSSGSGRRCRTCDLESMRRSRARRSRLQPERAR